MDYTINLWPLLVGALCGAGAAHFARGRNRLLKAAAIGAIIALVLGFLRAFL